MKNVHCGFVVLLVLALGALTACSGSAVPTGPAPGSAEQLTYQLSTAPDSTVDTDEVEGDSATAQEALAAYGGAGLPPDFDSVQGMHFAPEVQPDEGFSGTLTVELEEGHSTSQIADDTLLFLYYAPQTGGPAQFVSSARASGGWVSFSVSMLGYFVIATNDNIPAIDGVFIAHSFADRAAAEVNQVVNCWAVAQNGQPPYTFSWEMGDGTDLLGDQVAHAYATNGEYTVRVTVTDATGLSISAFSTPVTVTGQVFPPPLTVTASATQDTVDLLQFTFSANVTGGTPPYSYNWDLDGDSTGDAFIASPIWLYAAFGIYGCSLTVTDDDAEQTSISFVADARQLQLTGTPTSGADPLDVDFGVTANGFTAGDIIALDFGDGTTEDIAVVAGQALYETAHTYAEGNYSAQATGTSSFQGTDYARQSDPIVIDVGPTPPPPYIQFTEPVLPQQDQTFTIRGFNFNDAQGTKRVMLGTRELAVVGWAATAIEVQYPGNYPDPQGLLIIDDPDGQNSPNVVLVTLQTDIWPESVQTILPLEPEVGERVLIIGHGFGTAPGTVNVGGVAATVESWNTQCIVATLGNTAPTGNQVVQVTAGGVPLDVSATVIAATGQPYPALATATPALQEIGIGATMDLAGTDFDDGVGGLIVGNAMTFPVNSWADTLVNIGDPPQSFDGDVFLLNQGLVSGSLPIAYVRRPVINSLESAFGAIGGTFLIDGQYFGTQMAGDQATLGGVALTINYWQDDEIEVTLPVGVDDGDVVVEKKLNSNGMAFDVVPQTPGQPTGDQI